MACSRCDENLSNSSVGNSNNSASSITNNSNGSGPLNSGPLSICNRCLTFWILIAVAVLFLLKRSN